MIFLSSFSVLLFLDISGGELLVIMLVAFLVFGPEKMPEMARKVGKAMNQMKKASNDLTREFKKESSSLQNEINKVKTGINTEIDSVSREYSNTKSKIYEKIDEVDNTIQTTTNTETKNDEGADSINTDNNNTISR